MRERFYLPTVLCLCAAAARAADGDPVTRWGGSASPNMASSARDLPADIEKTKPLWELRLGTHQYAVPTIDRGRIYIGVDDAGIDRPGIKPTGGGLLVCVEQATGKLIWRMYSPRYFEGMTEPYHFDQWKGGFCSSPVIEGDRLHVVGNRGEILCLDREGQANGNDGPFLDELPYMGVKGPEGAELLPTDGDIIWRFDMVKEVDAVPHDICASTLLLHGDLIYACTSNGVDGKHRMVPHPSAPSLIVLDKKTGRLVAKDGENIGQRLLHGQWASPSCGRVDGRTLIYFGGGDGILYAFEPPEPSPEVRILKRAWSCDCNPPDYRMRDGKPPPYSRDERRSREGPNEIIGTPVFHEGRVYVTIGQSPMHGAGQGRLTCVAAATGKEVWASKLLDRSLATVSIADGLVYVVDYSGNLHCFDAGTGHRYWVHEMGAGAWSASSFVADGKVYASTEANTLWVLKAGKEKQVLSSVDLDSMTATLTAADGVLYVPTQKRLTAYPGKPGVSRAEVSPESKDPGSQKEDTQGKGQGSAVHTGFSAPTLNRHPADAESISGAAREARQAWHPPCDAGPGRGRAELER